MSLRLAGVGGTSGSPRLMSTEARPRPMESAASELTSHLARALLWPVPSELCPHLPTSPCTPDGLQGTPVPWPGGTQRRRRQGLQGGGKAGRRGGKAAHPLSSACRGCPDRRPRQPGSSRDTAQLGVDDGGFHLPHGLLLALWPLPVGSACCLGGRQTQLRTEKSIDFLDEFLTLAAEATF